MTNEEAINTLKSLKDYYNDKNEDSYVGFDNEDNEAIDKAIKALEQQLTTKNVLNQLKDEIHDKGFNSPLMNPIFTYIEIIKMIDKYMAESEVET